MATLPISVSTGFSQGIAVHILVTLLMSQLRRLTNGGIDHELYLWGIVHVSLVAGIAAHELERPVVFPPSMERCTGEFLPDNGIKTLNAVCYHESDPFNTSVFQCVKDIVPSCCTLGWDIEYAQDIAPGFLCNG